MPSWNIHIAQTERLLERGGAVARCVRDRNAFLFGNLVPDIFVGYMVPDVEEPIAYRITHFATPAFIPKPREHEFWDAYVAPLLGDAAQLRNAAAPAESGSLAFERERMGRVHYPHKYEDAPPLPKRTAPSDETPAEADIRRSVFDLTLGTWAHLVADRVWNLRVSDYLDSIGGTPNEQFRIKKQGDFDWFGRTRDIDAIPLATERLYAAAERFAQYPISRRYVLETVSVAHEIVRVNDGASEHPPYRLLTDEFFDLTFAKVIDTTDALLAERAPELLV